MSVSERFPKERRLLKRADFLRVQRDGIGTRSRHFVLLIHRRADHEPPRLGVVASRKVGNAVARNRGKRRVREWFRRRLAAATAAKAALPRGADIVVILRRGSTDLELEAAYSELDQSLKRGAAKARRHPPSGRCGPEQCG